MILRRRSIGSAHGISQVRDCLSGRLALLQWAPTSLSHYSDSIRDVGLRCELRASDKGLIDGIPQVGATNEYFSRVAGRKSKWSVSRLRPSMPKGRLRRLRGTLAPHLTSDGH